MIQAAPTGDGPAARRASSLVTSLDRQLGTSAGPEPPEPRMYGHADPLAAWAGSGGAWLTGWAGGAPLAGGAPVALAMDAAAAAFHTLAGRTGRPVDVDGPGLLGWRAAAWQHGRDGARSAGGSCRLLQAADGWVAVNLPRPEDRDLLPAWLGLEPADDPWDAVAGAVRDRAAGDVVEAGQALGLPVAAVATPRRAITDEQAQARQVVRPFCWQITPIAEGRARRRAPLVVDLSSLWAGPLAAHLLARAGARIIKVESSGRPDGARSGPAGFFDLLHADAASVALDLRSTTGTAALRRLLAAADVVIEASRPRALDQLGCGPDDLLGMERDQVWVSITGYGRSGPRCQWAALGDDAGIAGGLAIPTERGPVFCADAVADPLAGMHAAVAALACWQAGGTHLVDVAMREVAAAAAEEHPDGLDAGEPAVRRADGTWILAGHAVRPPRLPRASARARTLGADNALLTDPGTCRP